MGQREKRGETIAMGRKVNSNRKQPVRFSDVDAIRGNLPLPTSLVNLMVRDAWRHPGHEVLCRCAPFIHDPLIVLANIEDMLFKLA